MFVLVEGLSGCEHKWKRSIIETEKISQFKYTCEACGRIEVTEPMDKEINKK